MSSIVKCSSITQETGEGSAVFFNVRRCGEMNEEKIRRMIEVWKVDILSITNGDRV